MAVPNIDTIHDNFVSLLSRDLFPLYPKEIPENYLASNGMIKELEDDIIEFTKNIYNEIIVFTSTCKTQNIIVNGGGGSPGFWTGGIGKQGKLVFQFNLKLIQLYNSDFYETKNNIYNKRISDVFNSYFDSFLFDSLLFGYGSSSHTITSPGTVSNGISIDSIIGNIGNVSGGFIGNDDISNFVSNIKSDFRNNGFSITDFLEAEIKAKKELIKYLLEYWLDNTKISNVIVNGGITSASSGILTNGIANGGIFS